MNIRRHLKMLKIAQVPGRGEPDSDGEINFKHVLATLESLNYQVTKHPAMSIFLLISCLGDSLDSNPFACSPLFQGWVGLEYSPVGRTEDGLQWINQWNYSL